MQEDGIAAAVVLPPEAGVRDTGYIRGIGSILHRHARRMRSSGGIPCGKRGGVLPAAAVSLPETDRSEPEQPNHGGHGNVQLAAAAGDGERKRAKKGQTAALGYPVSAGGFAQNIQADENHLSDATTNLIIPQAGKTVEALPLGAKNTRFSFSGGFLTGNV